jgi:hypothetical protein
VLGHVGQGLGDNVVGGHLDPLGQPPLDPHLQLHWDRGAPGQGAQGRAEAALGQDGRVDAAGELAQLLQRPVQPGRHLVQLGRELAQLGRHAVVQVPLDPAAGLVGSGHDPGPRGRQLRLGLGVSDRRCHQLGEVGQAPLGASWQRLLTGRGGDHDPPQATLHTNGRPDRRADTPFAGVRGGRPGGARVAVQPRRSPGLKTSAVTLRPPRGPWLPRPDCRCGSSHPRL